MTASVRATHTQGPWRLAREVLSCDRLVYIRIEHSGRSISHTSVFAHYRNGKAVGRTVRDAFGDSRAQPAITADECRANARLIAAAPDLLAALQSALRGLEIDGPKSAAAFLLIEGRAAIAKATGERSR